jgi:hypothetical protein
LITYSVVKDPLTVLQEINDQLLAKNSTNQHCLNVIFWLAQFNAKADCNLSILESKKTESKPQMVEVRGLEPLTSGLQSPRSAKLSYTPIFPIDNVR